MTKTLPQTRPLATLYTYKQSPLLHCTPLNKALCYTVRPEIKPLSTRSPLNKALCYTNCTTHFGEPINEMPLSAHLIWFELCPWVLLQKLLQTNMCKGVTWLCCITMRMLLNVKRLLVCFICLHFTFYDALFIPYFWSHTHFVGMMRWCHWLGENMNIKKNCWQEGGQLGIHLSLLGAAEVSPRQSPT